jgi:putative cell wall-binding protein
MSREASHETLVAAPSDTVLLATAGNFPDALAAGALAAKLDAPILLTRTGSVPDVMGDELARLSPEEVLILGGTAAVGAAVETALRAEGYASVRNRRSDRGTSRCPVGQLRPGIWHQLP